MLKEMETPPLVRTTVEIDFVKDIILRQVRSQEENLEKMIEQELTSEKIIEKIHYQISKAINWHISTALDKMIAEKIQWSKELNMEIKRIVEEVIIGYWLEVTGFMAYQAMKYKEWNEEQIENYSKDYIGKCIRDYKIKN